MTMRQLCAAISLSLLALAGCGPAPETRDSPLSAASDPILAADSPVALTPYAQEGDAALIRGTLVLEDGCLYLRNGETRILPTFPWPGTSWDAAMQTLTIFGRQRYRVGERIEAGGGFMGSDAEGTDAEAVQRLLVQPRPLCDTSRTAVLYFGPNDAPVR
jgi:hypothetical protein